MTSGKTARHQEPVDDALPGIEMRGTARQKDPYGDLSVVWIRKMAFVFAKCDLPPIFQVEFHSHDPKILQDALLRARIWPSSFNRWQMEIVDS